MRSRANIKSHPIHPILIAFPIAFFTGTLVFDVIGIINNNNEYWLIAYYLEIAGVGAALLAAITGFIDFLHTVPPQSSAKKRAAQHGLLNLTMVVLFLTGWILREKNTSPSILVLSLEIVGLLLMLMAGWLGGTLVYRNQIGVDPRYAEAGKWKEEYLEETTGPVRVAGIDKLKVNQMKLLHIGKKRIVLARTEETYVAFDDRCPHKGGSLAGGSMMCGTVQCPWHGSQFNVKDGSVTAGPAHEKIDTYTIAEKEGSVYLEL